jgi:hypothetical protein
MIYLRNALTTLVVMFSLALGAHADRSVEPREIYGRLLAPCCWSQTLDIHDSELATQLRVEIAEWLRHVRSGDRGRHGSAFGERVRAVPRARDPRQSGRGTARRGRCAARSRARTRRIAAALSMLRKIDRRDAGRSGR